MWPFSRKPKSQEDAMPDAFDEQPAADAKVAAKVEAPAPAAVVESAASAKVEPAGDCAELRDAAAQSRAAVQALADRHAAAKARCVKLEADAAASKAERDAAMQECARLLTKLAEAEKALAEATAVVSAATVPDGKPCAGDCEAEALAAFRAIEAIATNA